MRVRILPRPNGDYLIAFGSVAGKFAVTEIDGSGAIVSGFGAAGVASVGSSESFTDAILRPDVLTEPHLQPTAPRVTKHRE